MSTILSCYSNEKILIITTTKIASSYIRDYYKLYNLNLQHLVNVDVLSENRYYCHGNNNKLVDDVDKDFKKLLNNELDKDVLILIRNPFHRWVSAFAQDYIKTLFELDDNLIKIFNDILLKSENIQPELLNDFRKLSIRYDKYPFKEWDGNEVWMRNLVKIEPYIKIITRAILTNYFQLIKFNKIRLNDNHNKDYHSILENILRYNKTSNFKILDIDEDDLKLVLDLYEDVPKPKLGLSKKNDGSFFTKIIKDILTENRFKNVENILYKKLLTEFNSYNFLKNRK